MAGVAVRPERARVAERVALLAFPPAVFSRRGIGVGESAID